MSPIDEKRVNRGYLTRANGKGSICTEETLLVL